MDLSNWVFIIWIIVIGSSILILMILLTKLYYRVTVLKSILKSHAEDYADLERRHTRLADLHKDLKEKVANLSEQLSDNK